MNEHTQELPYLICGLGRSGVAAASLLRAEGHAVDALDQGDGAEGAADAVAAAGCRVLLHADELPFGTWREAIVSPGLHLDGAILSALRARQIPLRSEVELGAERFRGRLLAVTGSNGKSSVVKLLADAFALAGSSAIPCGNYGLPVCEAVAVHPSAQWLVIEVSSFQLETIQHVHPAIALLLNLLPNHLDRHGTMEAYGRLKARLFDRQCPRDVAIFPAEWADAFRQWSCGTGRVEVFGAEDATPVDWQWKPGVLLHHAGGETETILSIADSSFDNPVLGPAAAAAAAAAYAAGIPGTLFQQALQTFVPLPHRAQRIGQRNGVDFVDDSKATNLAALMASVNMQSRPLRLIAGGRPKETDFSAARPVLHERVRGVYLIGEAAAAMESAWHEVVACHRCDTLARAVSEALRDAQPGETLLLAPGCTSYDQFRSYGERGQAFCALLLESAP